MAHSFVYTDTLHSLLIERDWPVYTLQNYSITLQLRKTIIIETLPIENSIIPQTRKAKLGIMEDFDSIILHLHLTRIATSVHITCSYMY